MRSWVIGNSPDCDVVVDSLLASSRHCRLSQTADGYILDDLGSTNGTYVDGLRITSSIESHLARRSRWAERCRCLGLPNW